tara:strand:+ start:248 stop:1465 length:1218 start_codon:yes stop_codon:yes gene_type:complete
MYFKLVGNHTGNGGTQNLAYDSYRQYMMADLHDVLIGNITSASGLGFSFNTASSVITGTRPSTGIYSNVHDGNSSSTDPFFQIKKRHHGYLQNNSWDASRIIGLRWQDSYGIGACMGSHSTATVSGISNAFPNSNQYSFEGNGNTTSSPMYGYDYPSYVDRIEGILNDAVMVIQVKYSGGSGGNQYHSQTMIIVDTEYQPNIDDHMRSQYQYWCPTAYMGFTERFLEDNNTESYTSSSDTSGNVVGMIQTSGQSHQNENQYASSSSAYHMGYYSTNFNDYNYSSFFPPPWFDMPDRAPAAGGNSGYIMQPLMYYGRHGSVMTQGNFYHKNYKEFSALRGMWRTNDNSFFTGERVTDDKGRNYRAMRLYKTGFVNTSATGYGTAGHSYSYAHSRSATYLFPESGQL